MDERLAKALEFANYRQTLNNQLHKTKVRAENSLLISKNGGSFRINQELLCFVDMLIRKEMDTIVLLDNNNLPIRIENLGEFFDEILRLYSEITNDYHAEYEKIRKSRSVKSILDITENE